MLNYSEIVKRFDDLFEDVNEPDYNWRVKYSWVLFQCLYDDPSKKADGIKFLDRLWDNTKKRE